MSTLELYKKKLDLIAWINKLTDEDTLEFLDSLKRSKSKNDWWHGLSEDQKALLQNGMEEIEKGDVVSSKQFWKELKDA